MSDNKRKTITVWLSREVAIDAAMYAKKNETFLNRIIEELLVEWIEKQKNDG